MYWAQISIHISKASSKMLLMSVASMSRWVSDGSLYLIGYIPIIPENRGDAFRDSTLQQNNPIPLRTVILEDLLTDMSSHQ